MPQAIVEPVIRGVRFFLAHTPGLVRYGSKPARELGKDPGLDGHDFCTPTPVRSGRGVSS